MLSNHHIEKVENNGRSVNVLEVQPIVLMINKLTNEPYKYVFVAVKLLLSWRPSKGFQIIYTYKYILVINCPKNHNIIF